MMDVYDPPGCVLRYLGGSVAIAPSCARRLLSPRGSRMGGLPRQRSWISP